MHCATQLLENSTYHIEHNSRIYSMRTSRVPHTSVPLDYHVHIHELAVDTLLGVIARRGVFLNPKQIPLLC
jgi:hypothetical protein